MRKKKQDKQNNKFLFSTHAGESALKRVLSTLNTTSIILLWIILIQTNKYHHQNVARKFTLKKTTNSKLTNSFVCFFFVLWTADTFLGDERKYSSFSWDQSRTFIEILRNWFLHTWCFFTVSQSWSFLNDLFRKSYSLKSNQSGILVTCACVKKSLNVAKSNSLSSSFLTLPTYPL